MSHTFSPHEVHDYELTKVMYKRQGELLLYGRETS